MRKPGLATFLREYWRPMAAFVVCFSIVLVILFYRLDGLTNGYSAIELSIQDGATSIENIVNNPINIVPKIIQYTTLKLDLNSLYIHRIANVLLGLLIAGCMYLIIKNWHTTRIAIIGTMLLVSSSWFLHVARSGTYEILPSIIVVIILSYIWLQQNKLQTISTLLVLLAALLLLYTPAMIWFILAALIWQRTKIFLAFKSLKPVYISILGGITLIGVSPLVWSIVNDSSILNTWLGIPENFPAVSDIPLRFVHVISDIFVYRQADPLYGIGSMPFLDAFSTGMALLGVFAYAYRSKLDRTRLLFGFALLLAIAISIGINISMSTFLPVVYLMVAAGLTLSLQQWFTVFPRNPVARFAAIAIIGVCLMLTVFYHLNSYFNVWPKVPETTSVYQSINN